MYRFLPSGFAHLFVSSNYTNHNANITSQTIPLSTPETITISNDTNLILNPSKDVNNRQSIDHNTNIYPKQSPSIIVKDEIINYTSVPEVNYIGKVTFIHIGKCGGSTIRKELKKYNIKIEHYHTSSSTPHPIHYKSNRQYLIVIRNPIKRFISAFDWRYFLTNNIKTGDPEIDRDGKYHIAMTKEVKIERNFLNYYGTINNLAENIFDSIANDTIYSSKHLKMGIYWYIGVFLIDYQQNMTKNRNSNPIGVVVTETMADDMIRLFNIKIEKVIRKNVYKKNDTLSQLGYSNLRKYLVKDYECVKKLYQMGFVTNEQYHILYDY